MCEKDKYFSNDLFSNLSGNTADNKQIETADWVIIEYKRPYHLFQLENIRSEWKWTSFSYKDFKWGTEEKEVVGGREVDGKGAKDINFHVSTAGSVAWLDRHNCGRFHASRPNL